MTDLVKGFREVKQDKVSLATCCGVPHQLSKESNKLSFAWLFASIYMLKVVQHIVVINLGGKPSS